MKVTQYKALGLAIGTLVDRERGILEGLRPLAVQAGQALSDEQLLGAYYALASALRADPAITTASALHGRLYQQLAQQLHLIPDWDATVAFGSSTAAWPMFEDAPGALQYLAKFYRLVLIAPPLAMDTEAWSLRLTASFDAVVSLADDAWHAELEAALARLGLRRAELLPVRSQARDDPWAQRVDFPVCVLSRGLAQPWNHSPQALDGKRCEYASLADLAQAHQRALRA
ncbi:MULTISPECIES: haloacid dehalogenase [unclassified Pseudomonas]|uniref:haloacid dehalogenase n=1 Tax=unclassified Pseudomonas TaxID=196821 RepID=UPI000BCA32DE|nr:MULTISPECIES: haloacid dehalogenase [unclassified Pseudomonas]PVZ19698.1 hypothetical protein F474_00287 [Pseudomonas sp. URIL14HWK12:I12]PVZ22717.1 hypothetical protein F470_03213 [Pseudomonas sp. URIL14HWK12:I10]PVZ37653.1 hypothetical protein F472_00287 [Pseudomonas sp. URIL14HWK12:I11]SNZ15394.1 hypothetical protein SAMN05660463_03081 [Pseudomonas sp. URIL14HWK12:I9]